MFGPGPSYFTLSEWKRLVEGLNAALYVRALLLFVVDAIDDLDGSAG